jgi:hypothetical protein
MSRNPSQSGGFYRMKRTLVIPAFAALALCPSMVMAGLRRNRRFKVKFDMDQSSFSACPGGMLVLQVQTAAGRPVVNRKVTLSIGASANAKQTKRTQRNGYVAFDYSAQENQLQALQSVGEQDVACTVRVENPNMRSGFQAIPCPQNIELCCPDGLEPVICQGDMMFGNMCEAVKAGLSEDDCVSLSEHTPDCRLIRGYVKCSDDMWFPSLCEAEMWGYSMDTCDFADESEVRECAKTGHLICEGDMELANLCHAQRYPSINVEEDCVYI